MREVYAQKAQKQVLRFAQDDKQSGTGNSKCKSSFPLGMTTMRRATKGATRKGLKSCLHRMRDIHFQLQFGISLTPAVVSALAFGAVGEHGHDLHVGSARARPGELAKTMWRPSGAPGREVAWAHVVGQLNPLL